MICLHVLNDAECDNWKMPDLNQPKQIEDIQVPQSGKLLMAKTVFCNS